VTAAAARRGWETRREREEAVTVNLAPDERALWERAKGALRGTPARRLEKFEQYVHEHPEEVVESLQAHADARLEALIAEREADPDLDEREAGLNDNELALLRAIEDGGGRGRLADVAPRAFPELDAERAYSWARNSIRRPLKLGLVVRHGPGTYLVVRLTSLAA
jgi:hypothetical protein